MFHHFPFQAVIVVWVFLMGGEPQHGMSIMACHSVQSDKLLCCQSGQQIKQIVRVVNGKQEYKKKSLFSSHRMNTSNGRCIFLHSTRLQLSSFTCNATQPSQLGLQRRR